MYRSVGTDFSIASRGDGRVRARESWAQALSRSLVNNARSRVIDEFIWSWRDWRIFKSGSYNEGRMMQFKRFEGSFFF